MSEVKIISSKESPSKYDLWVHHINKKLVLQKYVNGKWTTIASEDLSLIDPNCVSEEDKEIWNNKADKILRVDVSGQSSVSLSPNTYYDFGTLTEDVSIVLNSASNNILNIYSGIFQTSESVYEFNFPEEVIFPQGIIIIEPNKTYQFTIQDGIGTLTDGSPICMAIDDETIELLVNEIFI